MSTRFIIPLMFGFLSLAHMADAQEVESKAYTLMLKTLLSHSVPEVSVKDSIPSKSVLLDARELNEFNVSKIEGATWVGYNDFTLDRVKDINKDCKIFVYCSVGYRSEKVAEKLIEAGYSDVSNLYGGIFEWVNTGQTVINSEKQKTSKVHAYDRVWGVWLNKGKKVYK